MNTNTPRSCGAVQTEQVCGIVWYYKQIFSDNKAIYELLPSNIKTLGLLFERWGRCLFNFELYILNKKNGVCYQKYLLDPGIQVWSDMAETGGNKVDVKEALLTQISGASYPNDQLDHPVFLPWSHGWNFPGSDGSVDLLQLSLLRFTHFDPASAIIAMISSSSSGVFWVTTLIFLGGWGGGWPSRLIFPEVESPYPFLYLAFVDGDNLILTSVSTQLFPISFSTTTEEVSLEELGSAVDNSEVEQWRGPWYPPLCVPACCIPLLESDSR